MLFNILKLQFHQLVSSKVQDSIIQIRGQVEFRGQDSNCVNYIYLMASDWQDPNFNFLLKISLIEKQKIKNKTLYQLQ